MQTLMEALFLIKKPEIETRKFSSTKVLVNINLLSSKKENRYIPITLSKVQIQTNQIRDLNFNNLNSY